MPQLYYVGLLAGENDPAALESGGDGRDINRHNYTREEIQQEVEREVVQRLLRLIRFRNGYPAFDGIFTVHESPASDIRLGWEKDDQSCRLDVDLNSFQSTITFMEDGQEKVYRV